jgi:putative membrane protein
MTRLKILLLRVLVAAAALGVATALVPGIELRTSSTASVATALVRDIELRVGSTGSKVLTLIVVALIVGIVNAALKPVIKTAFWGAIIVGVVSWLLSLGLHRLERK